MPTYENLPAKFWKHVSALEFGKICERGYLDADQCRRLWHMMDYQGDPPERLIPTVSKSHLMRLINREKKRMLRRT